MKFYVPDDLMIKVDRMCMAHGLETLSPFQDLEIASIVSQLPGSFKINVTGHDEIKTKFILKKVCEKRFPKHTLVKRKQGFGIPLERWLKQDGGRVVKEILLDHRMLNRPYFRKESLIKFVDIFLKGKGDYFFSSPNAIAGLIILEIWHQRYID
jgi:asparagine synthase (glutamine-hydrolysing)